MIVRRAILAKHLSKHEVQCLVQAIYNWNDDKFTWQAICEKCGEIIGREPSRQTLSVNPEINAAYKARKAGLLKSIVKLPRPSNLTIAAQRIARLSDENAELNRQNAMLIEKFIVWQYNAYKAGLGEATLNAPLPAIDRDVTI